MQNDIRKFIEDFISDIDIGMSRDINAFLESEEGILKYDIAADEKKTAL